MSTVPDDGAQDDRAQDDRAQVDRLETLGERLDVLARALVGRHVPVYAWAGGSGPVLERAEQLSGSWAQRFERDETGAHHRELATPPARSAASARSLRTSRDAGEPVSVAARAASAGTAGRADDAASAERRLPLDVRARLRAVVGPGADSMRVLLGSGPDAVARAMSADAVTVGTHVHVRAGRYEPDTPGGFALLAHEASHVTASLSGHALTRRAGPGGRIAEERAARTVEALASRPPGQPHQGSADAAGVDLAGPGTSPAVPAAVAPMHADPMRAEVDRPVAAPPPAPVDLEVLRRRLIEDVMKRLRSDYERGG